MNPVPIAKLVLVVFGAIVLAGCHSAPSPSPFTELANVSLAPVQVSPKLNGEAGLWVPRDTVIRRAGIDGVFVQRAGRARFLMVKLGQPRGDMIQVLSGLFGKETVLAGDLKSVHDGSPLAQNKK